MERLCNRFTSDRARRTTVAAVAIAAAVGLMAIAPAQAAHDDHGGGGHMGGGFHGRSGGFHAGGARGDGFHNGGFRGGFARDGRFRDRAGFGIGFLGGGYYGWPDYDWYGEPDYSYYEPSYQAAPAYGDATPTASAAGSYWYYCQNPAGYYPYVQQCLTQWQPVPPG
jgi:hypothetical protein